MGKSERPLRFEGGAAETLGDHGPFAQLLKGFRARPQQQAMADAVARAIHLNTTLVAEAGTGTGKTFAYLVPAILSGKKVIVSTGTKNLQDQLFHRDLPLVRKALGVSVTTALLKGRANYLCIYRCRLAEEEGRFPTKSLASDFMKVSKWLGKTDAGDIAELTAVPEDSQVWPLVTSTGDNCLGGECPDFKACHVSKARRTAQEADIVVINHHLLFADMAIKEGGFGELLPGANAFILDEAHQLPDIASNFFGRTVSGRQLIELAGDSVTEAVRDAADMKELPQAAERLEYAARDLRLALGNEGQRRPWSEFRAKAKVGEALAAVHDRLATLVEHLALAAPRGKGLERCLERCESLRERLHLFQGEEKADQVYWGEVFTKSYTLNCSPLDIAEPYQQFTAARPAAWIYTSATLAVKDSFDHFKHQLGIAECETAKWDSPFDYRRNAVFYCPEGMPDPNSENYTDKVIEAALPVLEASAGRAFLLFTSHRALKRAAQLLEGRIDYPLLVQGAVPRTRLLERFRQAGNAVLLGTGSFWEGVDVRGDALSCVIIDKLPFAAPDDPLLQARMQAIRRSGGNPFYEHQLPNSVITLKQGVGRLIRDVNDRGVMMLCDPRLVTRSYGRVFLESLPDMTRTRRLEIVRRFFAAGAGRQSPASRAPERPRDDQV